MALKIILYILSAFCIATVVLPFIKKDHWIFRIFDYPRLQKFTLIVITLALWLVCRAGDFCKPDYIVMSVLGISALYLGWLIVPYTPLGKKMIRRAGSQDETLDLLVSNVFQENRQYNRLISLVETRDPDIIFLLETNQRWLENVQSLKQEYPYSIEVPMENTYGLLFYSRHKIIAHEVNHLIDKEIPSIIADIEFKGRSVRIYGLHPTPPVPQENTHSTDRDAEILMVGKMAKRHEGPCLVIGDLNDVAWSYTTSLFLKVSGLLDPRRGRGLYSTFNSRYWLLRWPLDHFFVSGHFRLAKLNVEKNIGSDHFPISISLTLCDDDSSRQLDKDNSDVKLADKKIEAGLNNDPL